MAKPAPPAFVYRISTADEWAEFQRTGATLGGDLDRSTGCIHLSDLSQVKITLKNFFLGRNNLYILQIDRTVACKVRVATHVQDNLEAATAEETYVCDPQAVENTTEVGQAEEYGPSMKADLGEEDERIVEQIGVV